MADHYNLVEEPWVHVTSRDGRLQRAGLLALLRDAHLQREIVDGSPLVWVALHRLLLAIIHHALGPLGAEEWAAIWRAGQLPQAALSRYLEQVTSAFDLFDSELPFLQCPGLPEKTLVPATRLTPEWSSGRQVTLFDHHQDDALPELAPATAARWLLAHQAFCLSGCCGDGSGLAAVSAGPLAHSAVTVVTGASLFETLMLNLAPYDPAAGVPLPARPGDSPAWEQRPGRLNEALPLGYLDYLTWQSRAVELLPERGVAGLSVRQMRLAPGRPGNPGRLCCDPMVAYHSDSRAADQWRPWGLQREGVWWRDLARLLTPSQAHWRRPLVVEMTARRAAVGHLPPGSVCGLTICSLSGRHARVDFWSRHYRRLPATCLNNPDFLADLQLALGLAEQIASTLQAYLWQMAQRLALAGRQRMLRSLAGGDAGQDFWQLVAVGCERLVGSLTDDLSSRSLAIADWLEECRGAAAMVWERRVSRVLQDPGALRWESQLRSALVRELQMKVFQPWRPGELEIA